MSRQARLNRHIRRLRSKLARFQRRGWETAGLQRQLAECADVNAREPFSTGAQAWDVHRKRLKDDRSLAQNGLWIQDRYERRAYEATGALPDPKRRLQQQRVSQAKHTSVPGRAARRPRRG